MNLLTRLMNKFFGEPLVTIGDMTFMQPRGLAKKIQEEWDLVMVSAKMAELKPEFDSSEWDMYYYTITFRNQANRRQFVVGFHITDKYSFDRIKIENLYRKELDSTDGNQNMLRILKLVRERLIAAPDYKFTARDII